MVGSDWEGVWDEFVRYDRKLEYDGEGACGAGIDGVERW